jgi:hypothetical protein
MVIKKDKLIKKSEAIRKQTVRNVDNVSKKAEQYTVAKAWTGKQIIVTKDKVLVTVNIDREFIELTGKTGREFYFASKNNAETLDRWEEVLSCMLLAVQEAQKDRELKR